MKRRREISKHTDYNIEIDKYSELGEINQDKRLGSSEEKSLIDDKEHFEFL